MKRSIKRLLATIIIMLTIFTLNAFGLTYEASNYAELENIIFEQMSNYNTNFKIKYSGSLDNIEEVLKSMVAKDIYVNSNISKVSWNISGTNNISNIKVDVKYIISPEERIEADREIDRILDSIIKPFMNDHEKAKAVHDYIVLKGEYDLSYTYYSDYDLLTKGTSVCNGYALLTYNMLNKLNIPVRLVSGKAGGENHIWNMVKLGNYWFHLDTTWNDPINNKDITYTYYMLTENEISKDHIIDKNLNKYKRQYFGGVDENGRKYLLINCFWSERENSNGWLNGMVIVMDGGSYYWQIKYYIDTNELKNLMVNGYA